MFSHPLLTTFPPSVFLRVSFCSPSKSTEKAMAPHSSTLAWKIPWTEEPGELQSMGLLRIGHNCHALEKEMATHSSVLAWRIPGTGEPGGLPSVGSHRVGHDWRDLAAAAFPTSNKSDDHSQCKLKVQKRWIWKLEGVENKDFFAPNSLGRALQLLNVYRNSLMILWTCRF